MAVSNLVIGTVMGLVLLVIVGIMRVVRGWRRQSPGIPEAGSAIEDVIYSPVVWTVLFVVFALGIGMGGVVFVGGVSVPGLSPDMAGTILLAAFGLLLVFFLFVGIYASVRARGAGSAPAIGVSSVVIGLLAIAAIVLRLLLG